MDKAEGNYREARKAHTGSPEDLNRYTEALARVLQREGAVVPAGPAGQPMKGGAGEQPEDPEASQLPEEAVSVQDEEAQVSRAETLRTLLLMAMLMSVAPEDEEDPAEAARLKESVELAQELIKSDNPKVQGKGYMILGQARARQGNRTEGLKQYVKGLELVYPGASTKDLAKMVERHPAFQQPDSLTKPNQLLAEKHFGKGLDLYWAGKYADAEEQFKKSVSYFGLDARAYYFLGLSRWQQKGKDKRAAARYNFEQALRLEQENRPGSVEVNSCLERVQGNVRQLITQIREKGLGG